MTDAQTDRLRDCLPADLRGPATTITTVSGGLSGAGVHRVDANGETFLLKVSKADEPLDPWRTRLEILRSAAGAGVAPRVVHADEERRAVLSAFAAGKPFVAAFYDPRTRDIAVEDLGRTLRRLHDLPLPAGVEASEPREVLATAWSAIAGVSGIPAFVGDAVRRVLGETPPRSGRERVLSHNDVNPGNVLYDGDRLLLVDWDVAGRNDPWWDLATIALFCRMDDETCRHLLSAHDGEPVAELPPFFVHSRRLVAVVAAVVGTQVHITNGRLAPPPAELETLESALTLGEFYQRLRTGQVRLDSPEGTRAFTLALAKESFAL